MSGLVESAAAILGASERRLETISNNVSNISTPGFKRQIDFNEVLSVQHDNTIRSTRFDPAQGKLSKSDNSLDLAISGVAFFQLRSGKEFFYSRQGQFRLADDGTVVTPQGYVVQQSGGGDLILENPNIDVLEDGTVLDHGQPVARIGLFAIADHDSLRSVGGSLFTAEQGHMQEASGSQLRQGMIEMSNVSLGDEMVGMMEALRQAESGARLTQVYDDLIGRAITTLGQGGR